MHFFGCRQSRRLRLAVPAAAASPFGGDSVRWRWPACAGLDSRPRAAPHSRGYPPLATARHLAPRQSGSSPGCCRIVREVSERSRRPSAVSGMPLPLLNQRHGVPCLARCISPVAAVFSRLGTSDAVFRARAGFPRQTPDCSRRVRLPGLPGVPRFTAVAIRSTPNCFDAPRTPWTSGWPRRGRTRAATKRDAFYRHHQRVTS